MEGAVVLLGFGGMGVSGLLFFFWYKARPAKSAFTRANSIISALFALTCVILAWILPRSGSSERAVTIIVKDSARLPVKGAELTYYVYQHRPVVGGMTQVAQGSMTTDAQGKVVLRTSWQSSVTAVVRKENYRSTLVAVQPETPQGRRDYEISWDRSDLPPDTNQNRVSGHWPARQDQTLIAYLAGKNDGNAMPYDPATLDVIWPPR